MPEPMEPGAGLWKRFHRYEVVGSYIRPAEGAELQTYDPWELWSPDDRTSRPYTELTNLITKVPVSEDETGRIWIEPEGKAPLERWCSQYGLLGVLLHRTRSVTCAPRWRKQRTGSLAPSQCHFFRTSVGWEERVYVDPPVERQKKKKRRDGNLVDNEDMPSRFSPPGVVLQDLVTAHMKFEPLDQTWARFFPAVPQNEAVTYEYPLPYESEEFWRLYAEPVEDFLMAGRALRQALIRLLEWKAKPDSDQGSARRGMNVLNSLVTGVASIALPQLDGTVHLRWVSPSLLGSLAMMALQDLSELRRLLRCANCGKLFVTKTRAGRYCSIPCRNTAQKREYRRRKREGGQDGQARSK